MKKSDAYKTAQLAVLSSECISDLKKLAILAVLMEDEKLALFQEENEVEQE